MKKSGSSWNFHSAHVFKNCTSSGKRPTSIIHFANKYTCSRIWPSIYFSLSLCPPLLAPFLNRRKIPRPVFISSGSPQIEGQWVDAKGMFLSGVHAGLVYKLLRKRTLTTSEFPPLGTPLVIGDIAFRQHAGGHSTGPNWSTWIAWAGRYWGDCKHFKRVHYVKKTSYSLRSDFTGLTTAVWNACMDMVSKATASADAPALTNIHHDRSIL